MKYLRPVIFSLLIAISLSLTFNFSQAESSQSPTILIFRKNKPSILIFPSNQSVTLNYPKRQQFTQILLGAEPTIKFGKIEEKNKIKSQLQQPKSYVNIPEKNDPHSQKQTVPEKQAPVLAKAQKTEKTEKTEKAEQKEKISKYPLLSGTFSLLHSKSFNIDHMGSVKFNGTHISYTICSHNSCVYLQEKGSIQIGSCELVPSDKCKPFEDLFYADMRFLAQLKLIESFKYQDGKYKFYDQQHQKRFQLQKVD